MGRASETCRTLRVTIYIKWEFQSREGAGKKCEGLMAENFPNLVKNSNLQI